MRFLSFLTVLLGVSFSAHSAVALYTPQQALKDATSEPLTHVSSFISKHSESGLYPHCIFRNSKVIVISAYCVKGDVPAAGLLILSSNPEEGYVRLYAELTRANQDISNASRSDYADVIHSSVVKIAPQPYSLSMTGKQIQNWSENETGANFFNYCVTTLSQKDQPNSTYCTGITTGATEWGAASFKYWKNSDPNFTALLKSIKAKVP